MGQKYYIGVDVGGTKVAAGLVLGQKVLKKEVTETQARKNKKIILQNIAAAVEKVFNKKVKAIGLGVPGQVDQAKGLIVSSRNFSRTFANVEIKKFISQKFKVPVEIDNDANCFTLGEATYGKARSFNHVAGLTLGTGVGGGIVINKKIYHGASGLAGELGQTVIFAKSPINKYKTKGCLEDFTSGTALTKIFEVLTGQAKTAHNIVNLAKKGHKKAQETLSWSSLGLAIGLANITLTLNPDIIVIGGGLAKEKTIVSQAIQKMPEYVSFKRLKKTKIVVTDHKKDMAVLGAAALLKK